MSDLTTLPRGFSEAAQIVAEAQRRSYGFLADSETFSKQSAYDELAEVGQACRAPDWDAHGAEAVEQDTLRNAYILIESLPLDCPLPSIGAEPDGHITLEWYRATNWLLSVSVTPDGLLHYAALLGNEDPRGTCPLDGEVPKTILYWIRRVCIG